MGMDASYLIRFATAEAARTALEAITSPERRNEAGFNGLPIYDLSRGHMHLSAHQISPEENTVWVSSGDRWLDPEALYGAPELRERRGHRAPSVLDHLEFLTGQEALKDATITYGADYGVEEEDFVLVDEDFMNRLRQLVAEWNAQWDDED